MSVLLRDGDWTTSTNPVLGAVVLPASLIAGVLVAVSQQSPLWAYDFWPAPVMIAIGALGAAPGVWAALGYLIALLFVWHDNQGRGLQHAPVGGDFSYADLRYMDHGMFYSFGHTTLPVIVVAMVLLQLAVIVPAAAVVCRSLISRRLQRHPSIRNAAEGALSTVIIVLLAYQWHLAAQYAIRPFWTFSESVADTAPVAMLGSLGWALLGAAVVASLVRWTATTLVVARRAPAALPRRTVKRVEMPWPVTTASSALIVTLLAAGVLSSVEQGVLFFAVVAGGLILRNLLLPRIPGFAHVVNLVPAAVRLVALFVLAYLISAWRVGAAYAENARDLSSFAITAGLTVLTSAVFLVAPQPTPWLPNWIGHRGATPSQG
jgi:hypothetical protein